MTTTPRAPRDGAAAPAKSGSKTAAKTPSAARKTAPPAKKTAPARTSTAAVTTPAEPMVGGDDVAAVEPRSAPVVPLRAVPAAPNIAPVQVEEKKSPGIGALLLTTFRNTQSAIARAVGLAALIVAVVIIVGIALVLGGANAHNGIVKAVYGLDGALVHPFAGDLHQPLTTAYVHNQQAVFGPKTVKKFVVENWGLAMVVYLGAGVLLARLVRFGKA